MDRRRFVALIGSALAAPLARAQKRVVRVGLLSYGIGVFTDQYMQRFRDSIAALGYVEGRDIRIELRRGEQLRATTDRLAAELLAGAPDLVLGQGYAIRALADRTKTIPILCAYSGDMVDAGLVKSLAKPGTNVTGIQLLALDLVGKRLELLRELLPGLRSVAVIADPQHPGEHRERDVALKAAERLGIRATYYPVRNFAELDVALSAAHASGDKALLLFPDSITNNSANQVAEFALRRGLATVADWANYADAGQLITYGPNLHAAWQRLAHYADRIFRGASPADLPVEMPSVLELVVNLKTASALGLRIPPAILLRADRVIE